MRMHIRDAPVNNFIKANAYYPEFKFAAMDFDQDSCSAEEQLIVSLLKKHAMQKRV